jgi:hypothetical protein
MADALQHAVLGVRIEPEPSRIGYERRDYYYPPPIEGRIVTAQGGVFSPYSIRCFRTIRDTDIEHIVAAEAHDSGAMTWTLAAPELNRQQKSDRDPAEWMPEHNRCWYVGKYVEIKRKYGLSMDRAEADSVLAVYEMCDSFDMVKPTCGK